MKVTNIQPKKQLIILIIVILILLLAVTTYWLKFCRSCQIFSKQTPTINLAEIESYKGVSFMSASDGDLQEAKNLGANIVELGVSIQQNKDGIWGLRGSTDVDKQENWQEKLFEEIKSANKLGLQVAVNFWFPTGGITKDPEVWLDKAKPLYEELGKFAQENNIYTIFIPGEVELATGTTCCGGGDLKPTFNNELSNKGFIYWSSKISQEIKKELRKNYSGRIIADYITGNWWFERERLIGPDPWSMTDFYAIRSGIQLDDSRFDTDTAQTSQHRAKVLREVATRSGVTKVIFSGPLANNLERIQGREFSFSQDQRRALYKIFFQETSSLVDGYFLRRFPPNLSDPVAEQVAKEWWEKID